MEADALCVALLQVVPLELADALDEEQSVVLALEDAHAVAQPELVAVGEWQAVLEEVALDVAQEDAESLTVAEEDVEALIVAEEDVEALDVEQ